MRLYEVRPGDSPASIAAFHAGCPKCAKDLVAANTHKAAVTKPNGFRTFKELRVGEKLNLPDKWFDGSMDRLPASYFASLPHHDGVTKGQHQWGTFAGVGDPASDAVTALAMVNDPMFSAGVGPAAALIDQSVIAADSNPNPGIAAYAAATHIATNSARARNTDMAAAIARGDQASTSQARLDIQNDLLTAVDSAGLAISAMAAPPSLPGNANTLQTVAQAMAAAIAADPNFCANVAQAGSAVNTAVHAFKTAWNAANPGNPVPVNTGTYDQATAAVLTQVLGTAPPACAPRVAPPQIMPPPGVITPPQAQASSTGLSTGEMVGMGVLGASVIGGFILFMKSKPTPRVRRVRASHVRRVFA